MRQRGLAASIWPGWAAQPPPGTITAGSRARAAVTASRSIAPEPGSPTMPKIWRDRHPHLPDQEQVDVEQGAPSASATSWPTVLLPAPGSPTSRMWRPASQPSGRRGPERGPAGAQRGDVAVVVPPHLGQRVAAELLQHRVGQHDGDHRLGDDAQRGHRGHVRALALGVGRPAADARSTVGSGDIRVEIGFIATRTTSGSPVVMPPSSPPALLLRRRKPPRGSPPVGRPPRCAGIDRIVHRGARPPGRLEAEPDLDALHRGDGHEHARPAGRRASGPSSRGCRGPRPRRARPPRPRRPACRRPAWPASIRRTISASTAGSSTRTSERSAASLRGTGSSAGAATRTPPRRDDVAPDLDPELVEQPPGQGAGGHPRRGLPGAGPLEDVARVEPIVLEHAGEVGVARAGTGDPAAAQLARLGGLVAP